MSTDRQVTFSAGPVPFMAIDRYADRYGFSAPEDFRVLKSMIRAMDAEYRRIVNKPTKKGEGSE